MSTESGRDLSLESSTTELMSRMAASKVRTATPATVGPINGSFRDYYFSVCNLTGSTANMPATTVRMLVIAQ